MQAKLSIVLFVGRFSHIQGVFLSKSLDCLHRNSSVHSASKILYSNEHNTTTGEFWWNSEALQYKSGGFFLYFFSISETLKMKWLKLLYLTF